MEEGIFPEIKETVPIKIRSTMGGHIEQNEYQADLVLQVWIRLPIPDEAI